MVKPRYRIIWFGERKDWVTFTAFNNEYCTAWINYEQVGVIARVS